MALQSEKLDVAVIGAGIAGLSAAIGLCRAGHNVEIFERSSLANEVGAAIHACPNAGRILKSWNFDFEKARAVVVREGHVLDGSTLAASYSGTYETFQEEYQSEWYFVHRVDLHNELKRLAQEPGEGLPFVTLRLASPVTSVECENGVITLEDGTAVKKDLVIAADGVHSFVASIVNEHDISASETGQSAFRFLIPTQKLVDVGLSKPLYIDHAAGLTIAADSKRRLVWYPCRNSELQNFVGIHPSRAKSTNVEEWNVGVSVDDLVDEYQAFHPDVVKTCRMAEDLKLWKLLYRSPISKWYKGVVALAGDAAHPMLPHQGQGGSQGIEDGAALGALFTAISSKEDIPKRLKMYQDVRQNRAAAIQIFSNAGQDQAEMVQEEAKKYVQGHIPQNQADFHKFNFGHDVVEACRAALDTQA